MKSKSHKIRKMKGGSEKGISGEIYIFENIEYSLKYFYFRLNDIPHPQLFINSLLILNSNLLSK